mmetsp:Transcript_28742/g.81061  ORF Transcript_28742/g.81061 Transcript_28742/m.81061 type:complete len:214 (+) Transcript_28742:574-1215(+)
MSWYGCCWSARIMCTKSCRWRSCSIIVDCVTSRRCFCRNLLKAMEEYASYPRKQYWCKSMRDASKLTFFKARTVSFRSNLNAASSVRVYQHEFASSSDKGCRWAMASVANVTRFLLLLLVLLCLVFRRNVFLYTYGQSCGDDDGAVGDAAGAEGGKEGTRCCGWQEEGLLVAIVAVVVAAACNAKWPLAIIPVLLDDDDDADDCLQMAMERRL